MSPECDGGFPPSHVALLGDRGIAPYGICQLLIAYRLAIECHAFLVVWESGSFAIQCPGSMRGQRCGAIILPQDHSGAILSLRNPGLWMDGVLMVETRSLQTGSTATGKSQDGTNCRIHTRTARRMRAWVVLCGTLLSYKVAADCGPYCAPPTRNVGHDVE